MRAIDRFSYGNEWKGFVLTKTVTNKLIPVGRTREFMDSYGVVENDISRMKVSALVKEYINRVHKRFISRILGDLDIDWSNLLAAFSQPERSVYTKEQDRYRKLISSAMTGDDGFKNMFNDFLFSDLLPEVCSEEELEAVDMFDGWHTYFQNFNDLRKFLYSNERKKGTVAYRIVNDNFGYYAKNLERLLSMEEENPELFENECIGKVKDMKFPVTDEEIAAYNLLISGSYDGKKCTSKGANQLIKEFNDSRKKKVLLLKKLDKNILSDTSPLFTVEVFDSTFDIINAVKDFHAKFAGIYEKFLELEIPRFDDVYVSSGKQLNILSFLISGEWNLLKNLLSVDENGKEVNLKKYYSLEEVNNYYQKYLSEEGQKEGDVHKYFTKLLSFNPMKLYEKIPFDRIEDIRKEKKDAIPLKDYLQEVLDFYNLLRVVSVGDDFTEKLDAGYYGFLDENLNEISPIVALYNKTRNYVTKKYCEEKKVKLNFETAQLLKGWDVNKEYTNNAVMFHDDESDKYYLGIFNVKSRKVVFTLDENSSFKKMYIKFIKDPLLTLPKIAFAEKNKKLFNPPDELYEKYKKGLHKKGENFDISFLHELIDFFKFCMENYSGYEVFDFKFRDTAEYTDISEFYEDITQFGYNMELKGVSKDEVFNAAEDGSLFLFEIYNRHLAGKSHGKDIHTEYFRHVMTPENDIIRLSGNGQIFLRPKLMKAGITHAKGSYIINKNSRSGYTIPRDVYLNINRHLNSGTELSEDARKLMDSGEVVYKKADRDLVKDRRFSDENITFHLPLFMNYKSPKMDPDQFNKKVIDTIKDGGVNIVAVNRGENNLLVAVVMDENGKVIESRNFNIMQSNNARINYKNKLRIREMERKDSRLKWQEIDSIARLKDGYLSLAVSEIAKMVVDNNAVLVMEDLSSEFISSRAKIERNVYQRFQTKMIEKLSYLVFKNAESGKPGSIEHPYQLCLDAKNYKQGASQFGWIFFLNSAYISKIISGESYVDVFDFSKITNFEKRVAFLSKFDSIKKTPQGYEFKFHRKVFNKLFEGEDVLLCSGTWNVWNQKEKKFESVDVSDTMEKAFTLVGLDEMGMDCVESIKKLNHTMVNISGVKMILECLQICAEKKSFVGGEWEYQGTSWDVRAAENLALKMRHIFSLGMNLSKFNKVQNAKTAAFMDYLKEER